jgi:osmotically inducible protein OsmC
MPERTARARWQGNLKDGKGTMKLGSGAFEGSYTFASRFENARGTNPEELIGAAHAGCFSMALAHELSQAGYTPQGIETEARVTLANVGNGFEITSVVLHTEARVPGIDEKTLRKYAEEAKMNCPVSRALKGLEIKLQANLVES